MALSLEVFKARLDGQAGLVECVPIYGRELEQDGL